MEHDTDDALRSALAPALGRLRGELATRQTPPGVEKELLQAFARLQPARPWYQRLSPLQWGLAGGASSLVAMAAVLVVALQVPSAPRAPGHGASVVRDGGSVFIALDSLERIEQESATHTVQAELTGADLASMGVPVNPEAAGDTVRAELLVGSEGQPLALRFL
ncbi:hypothetical protein [Massilia sp. TS11]|uniref:hypothetical protein n=1 Tax=Massilia sp. TS11 TaxID=2908003 RepID=UPI001EDC70F4|nr:hypothetical protein [Massilia sp. TS11]MCG2585047.1 hypothetical protein [Massilia sp. TS11]